jgi:HAD superfamily hydrolase (TIGR01509 family)
VFRSVFISYELGVRKPDAEAFVAVADLMAVEPSAVLFFDDSIENVEGAESAGMQAELVESTDDLRRALRQVGCV